MADIFCDENTPDYVQFDCGVELAGIVGIGLIDGSVTPVTTELEDPAEWTTWVDDSPQLYFPIQETRGSYPGGTPVEEEGFGTVPTLRTGADHEATVEVRGVEDNRDFWAKVNRRSKWHVVLITRSGLMLYLQSASVYAKIIADQSIKSQLRWNVSIKWTDDLSNPEVLTAPTGIFY